MKHVALITALALLPGQLLAHDAGGIAHLHPHGGEALLALAALTVSVLIWRMRKY